MRAISGSGSGRRVGLNTVIAGLKRDDGGWTLVELLVAMFIIGIIIAAVANALIVGFTTSDDTSKRFAESHDAQIASATLAKDVQNAASITSATNAVCGAGALIAFSQDGTTPAIGYYYGVAPNGETQVMRRQCDGTGSQVLAHFAATSGAPTITCDAIACNPGSRPKPNVVQISVTEQSGYVFNVLGARRRWACAGGSDCAAPVPAKVSFLGLGLTGTGLSVSKASVVANSGFYVNSASAGAVTVSGCNKPETPLHPYCLTVTPDTAFKILTGGTCVGCVGCPTANTSPCPGSFPQIIDPLANLAAPDEAGLPRYSDGAYHGPGVYTTLLNINHDQTMASGIYILEKGFTFQKNGNTGQPSTITGDGVMLFNGCGKNAPVGCTSTGKATVQGKDNTGLGGTTVDLSPPTCGQYQGILIFQARDNTQTIAIGGGSSVSSFSGTIYAAKAGVDWSGTSSFEVDSVISGGTMVVTGGSKVTISPANQVPQPC